jgi:ABC-2 type transport system permease protein
VEQLNEVAVIWAAEIRRAVRSARVVTLLALYLMFTALVLLALAYAFRQVQQQIDDQIALGGATQEAIQPQLDQLKQSFLGGVFGDDGALLEALAQVPLIVLLTFKVTLFFLPLYIAVMGFDQISGEIGPRSIRYLTVRARRSSILWGKYLSQATLLAGLVMVVDLAVIGVARWLTPSFQAGAMATTLLKCWLAATVFSLAYVALSSFCSALFRSAAVSLIFNLFALFGFWLVNAIGEAASRAVAQMAKAAADPDGGAEGPSRIATVLSWLQYVSPSHYSTNLLHPHFLKFLGSTGIYAGFAAAFLALGYLVLRRRDL